MYNIFKYMLGMSILMIRYSKTDEVFIEVCEIVSD